MIYFWPVILFERLAFCSARKRCDRTSIITAQARSFRIKSAQGKLSLAQPRLRLLNLLTAHVTPLRFSPPRTDVEFLWDRYSLTIIPLTYDDDNEFQQRKYARRSHINMLYLEHKGHQNDRR
jgi:hypothetical protein